LIAAYSSVERTNVMYAVV